MSVLFSSVKYMFKNFWYVLLFAVLPAIFLALSLDYRSIHDYVVAFLTGEPRVEFLDFFCIWSLFHFHSLLSIIYGVCTFVCVVVSASFLFVLVEKHMRLGRRTPNGVLAGFKNAFLPVLGVTALYFVLYELFVVVLSSLLFAVSSIPNTIAVYFLTVVVYFALFFALFCVASTFYLWLPCKLMTGFSVYDTFRYSYRLAAGERTKLVLAFTLFTAITVAVVALSSLLPSYAHYIVTFVLFAFAFLDFCIRMETVYFKADKLDREDIVHSYKEY